MRSWLVGMQGPGCVCVPGAAAAVAVTTESARAAARVRTGFIGKVLSKGEFAPGLPYVFFTDPDGYEVEVWFETPTPYGPAEPSASAQQGAPADRPKKRVDR